MKKISGFTIIELITVMAIAGILLAIAVPSMRSFSQKGKISSFGNEMVSALQIARSEAIKRSGIACVCPTANANDPIPVCSGSNDWESGWIAFFDSTGNCSFNPGDVIPDVLLKVMDGDGFDNFTLRNNNTSINGADFIRFNARGVPVLANGAIQQGMFTVCDERGYVLDAYGDTIPRGITLSAAGSVRTTKDASKVTACP